jgi:hypothetical protein
MGSFSSRVRTLHFLCTYAITAYNKKTGLILYCKLVKLVGIQELSFMEEQPQPPQELYEEKAVTRHTMCQSSRTNWGVM